MNTKALIEQFNSNSNSKKFQDDHITVSKDEEIKITSKIWIEQPIISRALFLFEWRSFFEPIPYDRDSWVDGEEF